MKFLIESPSYETSVLNTWRGIKRMDGFTVSTIAVPIERDAVLTESGITNYRSFSEAFKDSDFDLIFLSGKHHFLYMIAFALRSKLQNRQVVVLESSVLNYQDSLLTRILLKFKFKILNRTFPFFVGLSREAEKYLTTKGISKDKIKYLPYGGSLKKSKTELSELDCKRLLILSDDQSLVSETLEIFKRFDWPDPLEILVPKVTALHLLDNDRIRVKELVTEPIDELNVLHENLDLCIVSKDYDFSEDLMIAMVAKGVVLFHSLRSVKSEELLLEGINSFYRYSDNPEIILEQLKLALYFTHEGRRNSLSAEVAHFHGETYRNDVLTSMTK